jgi:hypothetical protein
MKSLLEYCLIRKCSGDSVYYDRVAEDEQTFMNKMVVVSLRSVSVIQSNLTEFGANFSGLKQASREISSKQSRHG